MKITNEDLELAKRFPTESSMWGFGASMADAKINPAQLQRLLKLNLIQPDDRSKQTGGYAGADGAKKLGAGIMGRHSTGFIQTK